MPLSRNCANESCLQLVPGGSSAAAVDEALDWLEEPAESGNDAGASESSSSGSGSVTLVLDPRLLTRHPDPQSPVNHPREQWQRVGCFVESSCDVLRGVLT